MARERVEQCVGERFKDIADNVPKGEFARQYLDKLINIEVPIPLTDASDARKLLNVSIPEPPTTTQKTAIWFFRLVQILLIVGIPVVVTFSMYILGQAVPTYEPITQSPSAIVAPAVQPPPSTAGSPARVTRPANSQPIPELQEREPDTVIPPYYGLVGIALVFIVGAAYWTFTSRPGALLNDSPEFANALDIWSRIVFEKHQTPRALKRFVNRVRFLAMRQRRNSRDTMPRWQRIFYNVFGWDPVPTVKDVTTPSNYIPEPELVALAALHHLDSELFRKGAVPVFLKSELKETITKHEGKFGALSIDQYRPLYLRMAAEILTT